MYITCCNVNYFVSQPVGLDFTSGLDFVSGSWFCQWVWIFQWVWIWKPHGPNSLLYHVIYTQPWHNIYLIMYLLILEPCMILKHSCIYHSYLLWSLHDFSELFILNHMIWKHWSFWVIHDHHFSHVLVCMEKMNFCGSLCSLLEYFIEKRILPDYLCKSHDHDHQWADFVMVWLP